MTDKEHHVNEGQHSVRDEAVLRELYHGKKLTMVEIADKLNTTMPTVRYWMNKHDIDRRSMSEAKAVSTGPPKMKTDHQGYETVKHCHEGNNSVLQIHRLVAISEFGFKNVAGMDVHHENEIPWDNRIENLRLLDRKTHAATHNSKHSLVDKLSVLELSTSTNLKYREIAEMKDIPLSTVCSIGSKVTGGA